MPLTSNKHWKSSSKNSKAKASRTTVVPSASAKSHEAFWPLVGMTFLVWILYRALFRFPVVFDETIGKAIFFGLPVWLYITMTNARNIVDTISAPKLKQGLLLGVAVGGVYAFAATSLRAWGVQAQVQPVALFTSHEFWWQFFLAICTAFWETILFFSWMLVVIQEKYKNWPLLQQITVVSIIFALFHIPNALIRFDLSSLPIYLILMFMFAIGQSLLFVYRRNAYALILSHALWGMVLLIHF